MALEGGGAGGGRYQGSSGPSFVNQQSNAAAKKGTGVYKPKVTKKKTTVARKPVYKLPEILTHSTSNAKKATGVYQSPASKKKVQQENTARKKTTSAPKAKVVTRTTSVTPSSKAKAKPAAKPTATATGARVDTPSTEVEVAPKTVVPEPVVPDLDDWYNQDSAYQAALGGLNSDKTSALARLAQDRTGYDSDFTTTLKNLGWDWGGDEKGDLSDYSQGSWDSDNALGAYGQGKTGLDNDFASRGLMDSSFFADALNNYNTDMNNQFSTLSGGRTDYMNARNQDESDANSTYTNALAQAKAESAARRANKYGLDTGA